MGEPCRRFCPGSKHRHIQEFEWDSTFYFPYFIPMYLLSYSILMKFITYIYIYMELSSTLDSF
jgi:hypothetical protein